MNTHSMFVLEAVPHGDPKKSSLDELVEGRADIALVSNNENFDPGVTTVMPMYLSILHVLVKRSLVDGAEDSRATQRTIMDLLTSGSVYAGPPGSPSRLGLEEFVSKSGFATQELGFIEGFDFPDCPDIFVVFSPILRDLSKRVESCGSSDYVLRGLDDPNALGHGSRVEAATLLNPSLKPFVVPAGLYGDKITPTGTVTLAVETLLVARDSVPPGVIYDLISEVRRLRPALSAKEPALFHGLNDDIKALDSTFVLHPGAQAYIERDEPNVYERYSGVAEVVVTLFFASFSGLIAAVRIYNIRRKNRIDVFYAEAIRLRKSVDDGLSASTRNAVITKVRMLQTSAFEMLVNEKLAADESFRIFITLSNDIIRELQQPSAPPWSQPGD